MKNNSVLNIYDAIRDYGFTSQDYFVHMLRFQALSDSLRGMNVVDIGCGKHTNLLKALCQMHHGPQFNKYIGIDYGDIKPYRMDNELIKSMVQLYGQCDFTNIAILGNLIETIHNTWGAEPYVVVCFEVLEHMDFDSQLTFVYHLSRLLHQTNAINCFFSTPNYNGSAAKNHICELGEAVLEEMLTKSSIAVVNKLGLSAWRKFHTIDNLPTEFQTQEVKQLLTYLDDNLPTPLMKMIWGALLDAKYSNNIMWTLTRLGEVKPRKVEPNEITNTWRQYASS